MSGEIEEKLDEIRVWPFKRPRMPQGLNLRKFSSLFLGEKNESRANEASGTADP